MILFTAKEIEKIAKKFKMEIFKEDKNNLEDFFYTMVGRFSNISINYFSSTKKNNILLVPNKEISIENVSKQKFDHSLFNQFCRLIDVIQESENMKKFVCGFMDEKNSKKLINKIFLENANDFVAIMKNQKNKVLPLKEIYYPMSLNDHLSNIIRVGKINWDLKDKDNNNILQKRIINIIKIYDTPRKLNDNIVFITHDIKDVLFFADFVDIKNKNNKNQSLIDLLLDLNKLLHKNTDEDSNYYLKDLDRKIEAFIIGQEIEIAVEKKAQKIIKI